jgi:DNA-binding transcriptional MerR regulator
MAPKARVQKRLYYKIGEACKALGIQPYVLRYWETEFPALSPSKSRSGQRVYSEKELEVIRRIKQLLYDEGYTIAGAKKKLEGELAAGTLGEPAGPPATPLAPAPRSPPAAPAVFQAPAASRAREQAAESERAGGGPVPLPLGPWAPPPVDPDRLDAAAASADAEPPAATAATAKPARADGSGSAATLEAAEASRALAAAAEAPGAATLEPEALPPGEGLPTLPLTLPRPAVRSVPATAAESPKESAAKEAGPRPRNAASRQVPAAATVAAAATAAEAGDRAAGPVAAIGQPTPASAPGHELDTAAAKQIETLRKGITKALQGAREILALLDSRSPH